MYAKENVLRDEIAMKGYTAKEFAEIIGISRTHLSMVVNRKKGISPVTARKISIQLDKELDYIFQLNNKEDSDNAKNKITTITD
ncbi:helix-turn-helix transcriptional regulator [Mammaliicoccus sciuri]|uniref:helix-turn-helix transcriptional regulator n=1 Tax=Mammaliicoccus sciuri TaxID=1296 RepID=UPI0019517A79|nr:helix-turn-helix transcriptional regulator [Mammaliicoccus sciuri]MCD8861397.1 helix-turn-helix transcriptional regulator [Mammaliicoccus sciuri]MEB7408133.1 helix-turn-helix transcriptional regulator [Mammaliicoccus sciuri]